MGYNYLFLISIFIITFIQAPKPENIQIFNIDDNSNKKGLYEINVLKNEIFGLQFTRGRGTNCHWRHSNDTFLKESNYLRFLNSSTWDYISEEYEKELKEAKNSTDIHYTPLPVEGGNEYYYELFKALNGGNPPQSLYFTYSCGDDIYRNASIDIWICDEIYRGQCVNNETTKNSNEKYIIEKLCNNSLTEEECISAEPINPKTSKCVFDNIKKK